MCFFIVKLWKKSLLGIPALLSLVFIELLEMKYKQFIKPLHPIFKPNCINPVQGVIVPSMGQETF